MRLDSRYGSFIAAVPQWGEPSLMTFTPAIQRLSFGVNVGCIFPPAVERSLKYRLKKSDSHGDNFLVCSKLIISP